MTMLLEGWWGLGPKRTAHRVLHTYLPICGIAFYMPHQVESRNKVCLNCLRLQGRYLPFDAKEE